MEEKTEAFRQDLYTWNAGISAMAAKKRKKRGVKKRVKKEISPAALPKPELHRLNKWYSMQLEEKEKIISRLKKENAALLATALKQGAKTREIFERAKKAMEKKKAR